MKLYTKNTNDVTYQYIKTNQFKTREITLRFLTDLKNPNITARGLMLSMLRSKSKQYPTRKAINKQLESLYDAVCVIKSMKLGTKHVNQITLLVIDDAYSLETNLFEQALDFLKALVLEPLFDEQTLNEEKQFLKDYFKAEYSNKNRYAMKRYSETLLEDYPYNQHAYGDEEKIDSITLSDISEAYEEMLYKNQIYISVSGDIDEEVTHQSLINRFDLTSIRHHKPIIYRHDFSPKKDLRETHDVTQTRVFMTLKSNVYFRDEDYFPMLVLTTLFGETSDSLLFKHVRETLSLAYYIHASYSPFTGLITIMSGMKEASIKEAKVAINKCLTDLIDGTFTDEDLTLAKRHIISRFKQSYDRHSALSLRAFRSALFKVPFKEEHLIEIVSAVSKREIIMLAKRLAFVYTYELGGDINDA